MCNCHRMPGLEHVLHEGMREVSASPLNKYMTCTLNSQAKGQQRRPNFVVNNCIARLFGIGLRRQSMTREQGQQTCNDSKDPT